MADTLEKRLENGRPEYAINQAIGFEIGRFARGVLEHYKSYSGLEKIANHSLNPDYVQNNLHQQSGFSAEIKHVANNNADAIIFGVGDVIDRTDNLGLVNHNSADVVSVDVKTGRPILKADGSFSSAGQLKVFKDYRKYRDLYKSEYEHYKTVDLVVPSDQYDTVLMDWDAQLADHEQQKQNLLQHGKAELAQKKEEQIAALKDARSRVKKSTVSTKEAMEARVSPLLSVTKDILSVSHSAGLETAKIGAAFGGGFSFVSNAVQLAQSKKAMKDAVADVLIDTGRTATGAYVTGATSTALSGAMRNASSQLVQNLGKSNAPATIVQAGAILGKSFVQLARGQITAEQFVSNVNKEGVLLATSMAGSNFGAIIGTVALPGVGTVVGSVIGGMVASMLSGSLYAELQRSVLALEESDRLRRETDEMCRALVEAHRGYQAQLSTVFGAFFEDKERQLRLSFEEISLALMSGRSIHGGLEKLAVTFECDLTFTGNDVFEEHLRSGKPLII